jgi:hypothetical protein
MTNRGKIYDFEIDPAGKWLLMAHEHESLLYGVLKLEHNAKNTWALEAQYAAFA